MRSAIAASPGGASSASWSIEGTAFALAIAAYFFLMSHEAAGRRSHVAPPDLLAGTLFTIVLLLSEIPNSIDQGGGRAGRPATVRRLSR